MATRSTFTNNGSTKIRIARGGQMIQIGIPGQVYTPVEDIYVERPEAGSGWSPHALRNHKHVSMSASGMASHITQPARFTYLRVNTPARSGTLTINVRNGGPTGVVLQTLSATAGATIDRTGSPDAAPAGLYLEVVGGPTRGLDVSVYYL